MRVWWLTLTISALGRWSQEDQEFKTIVNIHLWGTCYFAKLKLWVGDVT